MAAVDLYWIPLGAGAHVVRISGKLFEAVSALVARRPRCDLYHSALVITLPEGHFMIEQAPVPDLHGERRGVVAEGPVGMRWLGRFRIFRYEIRSLARGHHSRHQSGDRQSGQDHRRRRGRQTNPHDVAFDTDTRVGPRRVRHRRNVELELGCLLGPGAQRGRIRDVHPPLNGRAPGGTRALLSPQGTSKSASPGLVHPHS